VLRATDKLGNRRSIRLSYGTEEPAELHGCLEAKYQSARVTASLSTYEHDNRPDPGPFPSARVFDFSTQSTRNRNGMAVDTFPPV
jgi:hypothetical protein